MWYPALGSFVGSNPVRQIASLCKHSVATLLQRTQHEVMFLKSRNFIGAFLSLLSGGDKFLLF